MCAVPGAAGCWSKRICSPVCCDRDPLSLTPGLASRDLDEEFEAAFPGGLPSAGVDGTMDPNGQAGAGGYEEGEYSPYDQSEQYPIDPMAGPAPLSLLSKIGYVLGGLLLLGACGLFVVVLFTRVCSPSKGQRQAQVRPRRRLWPSTLQSTPLSANYPQPAVCPLWHRPARP